MVECGSAECPGLKVLIEIKDKNNIARRHETIDDFKNFKITYI